MACCHHQKLTVSRSSHQKRFSPIMVSGNSSSVSGGVAANFWEKKYQIHCVALKAQSSCVRGNDFRMHCAPTATSCSPSLRCLTNSNPSCFAAPRPPSRQGQAVWPTDLPFSSLLLASSFPTLYPLLSRSLDFFEHFIFFFFLVTSLLPFAPLASYHGLCRPSHILSFPLCSHGEVTHIVVWNST